LPPAFVAKLSKDFEARHQEFPTSYGRFKDSIEMILRSFGFGMLALEEPFNAILPDRPRKHQGLPLAGLFLLPGFPLPKRREALRVYRMSFPVAPAVFKLPPKPLKVKLKPKLRSFTARFSVVGTRFPRYDSKYEGVRFRVSGFGYLGWEIVQEGFSYPPHEMFFLERSLKKRLRIPPVSILSRLPSPPFISHAPWPRTVPGFNPDIPLGLFPFGFPMHSEPSFRFWLLHSAAEMNLQENSTLRNRPFDFQFTKRIGFRSPTNLRAPRRFIFPNLRLGVHFPISMAMPVSASSYFMLMVPPRQNFVLAFPGFSPPAPGTNIGAVNPRAGIPRSKLSRLMNIWNQPKESFHDRLLEIEDFHPTALPIARNLPQSEYSRHPEEWLTKAIVPQLPEYMAPKSALDNVFIHENARTSVQETFPEVVLSASPASFCYGVIRLILRIERLVNRSCQGGFFSDMENRPNWVMLPHRVPARLPLPFFCVDDEILADFEFMGNELRLSQPRDLTATAICLDELFLVGMAEKIYHFRSSASPGSSIEYIEGRPQKVARTLSCPGRKIISRIESRSQTLAISKALEVSKGNKVVGPSYFQASLHSISYSKTIVYLLDLERATNWVPPMILHAKPARMTAENMIFFRLRNEFGAISCPQVPVTTVSPLKVRAVLGRERIISPPRPDARQLPVYFCLKKTLLPGWIGKQRLSTLQFEIPEWSRGCNLIIEFHADRLRKDEVQFSDRGDTFRLAPGQKPCFGQMFSEMAGSQLQTLPVELPDTAGNIFSTPQRFIPGNPFSASLKLRLQPTPDWLELPREQREKISPQHFLAVSFLK